LLYFVQIAENKEMLKKSLTKCFRIIADFTVIQCSPADFNLVFSPVKIFVHQTKNLATSCLRMNNQRKENTVFP
jgi:hypothetical protein